MNLSLCRDNAMYEVGSTLMTKWRISRVPVEDVQSLELSVLWHTEGKGDEDLHVHHFYRLVESQIRRSGLADEQSTQCVLPLAPLSYHGRLVSVRWCVRLRLFLTDGREIVAESPFHLVSHAMTLIDPAAAEQAATLGDAADADAGDTDAGDTDADAAETHDKPLGTSPAY